MIDVCLLRYQAVPPLASGLEEERSEAEEERSGSEEERAGSEEERSALEEWRGALEEWRGASEEWRGALEEWRGASEEWRGASEEWRGAPEEWRGASEEERAAPRRRRAARPLGSLDPISLDLIAPRLRAVAADRGGRRLSRLSALAHRDWLVIQRRAEVAEASGVFDPVTRSPLP